MKKTCLLCVLLCLTGWVQAQTAAPADATKAPAPAAPAKKDDGKKKEDKIGKIDGTEIARTEGGGFIGVQVLNGVFRVRSYDAKKNPVAADFTKVALRWNVQYQKAPERTLLLPGGRVGEFSSEKVVKPPYSFKLFITLIKGEGDDAPVENYQIDFKGA